MRSILSENQATPVFIWDPEAGRVEVRDPGSAGNVWQHHLPFRSQGAGKSGLDLSRRKFEGKNLLAATHRSPLSHKVAITSPCERQLWGSELERLETP